MSASCCSHDHCHAADPHRGNESYRRVLWAVLAINAVMFAVEVVAGLAAGSASLQADALDFLGDAGNYAISLFVVGMALRYRAMAAFFKGATMGVFGLWVLGLTGWHAWHGTLPHAFTMGAVGFAALARQCGFVRPAVGLPRRRCQHAFGMGLHAQRRARQSRGPACGAWRVRHRDRLAGRDSGRNHGEPCSPRCMDGAQPVANRVALAYAGSGRVAWRKRPADVIGHFWR